MITPKIKVWLDGTRENAAPEGTVVVVVGDVAIFPSDIANMDDDELFEHIKQRLIT